MGRISVHNPTAVVVTTRLHGVWAPFETKELEADTWAEIFGLNPVARTVLQVVQPKPKPPIVQPDPFVKISLRSLRRADSDFQVNPVMLIMSVRRIPEVQAAFRKLTFLDRVYFRNYNAQQISQVMNDWVADRLHKYTHVLVSSDDITPTPADIQRLMADVQQYDLPVVAGCCNICTFDRRNSKGVGCGACFDGKPHPTINVTLAPVRLPPRRTGYEFLGRRAVVKKRIQQVWFQGNACAMISAETVKRFPFRSYSDGVDGLMQDLAQAIILAKAHVPQFVDFRVIMRHYGTHHGRLLVGKEKPRIEFKRRSRA